MSPSSTPNYQTSQVHVRVVSIVRVVYVDIPSRAARGLLLSVKIVLDKIDGTLAASIEIPGCREVKHQSEVDYVMITSRIHSWYKRPFVAILDVM